MAGVSWWIVGVTWGVVGVTVIVVGQANPPLAGGHSGGPCVMWMHAPSGHVWTLWVGQTVAAAVGGGGQNGHVAPCIVGHEPSGHVCWICVGHCAGLIVGHAPSGHVWPTCVGHAAGLIVGHAPSGHV